MTAVTVRAPAKVNLQLSVGQPRPDGFHEIVSVFQAVSLFDDVTVSPSDDFTVETSGEGEGSVPVDQGNLAVVAARLLAEATGTESGALIGIHKTIPVAGGMAGGSADAAATLLALDRLWNCGCPREQLSEVAAAVGSDVPFALLGYTAVGTGRGEKLTPALVSGSYEWVFAVSDRGLATPDVYRELDRLRAGAKGPTPGISTELMSALRAGDAPAVGRCVSNDLQEAATALRPDLRPTLEVGEDYGALAALVSGSGPTCAFLARDEEHALDLAVALSAAGVCRTVRRATGPVPGARVVET